jgi:hypothetical protein
MALDTSKTFFKPLGDSRKTVAPLPFPFFEYTALQSVVYMGRSQLVIPFVWSLPLAYS